MRSACGQIWKQLSTTMADSNELEVRAAVSVNALVISREEVFVIDSVEMQPLDMEKIQTMPGITVYMVKQGDTLWDIAKRFYTTVEDIAGINRALDGQIQEGQPLLLVQKVET